MKRNHLAGLSLVTMTGLIQACGGPLEDTAVATDFLSATGAVSLADVRDANGATPTDPAALLYVWRDGSALTAPDGTHLTLGDWAGVHDIKADAECEGTTSEVEVEAKGLVANGVYTVWQVDVGAGPKPLGAADGSENVMIADEEGEGELEAIAAGCNIAKFVVAYHNDDQTYGAGPGPRNTWQMHIVATF